MLSCIAIRDYNPGIPDPGIPGSRCVFTPGLNLGIVSQIPNPVLQSRDSLLNPGIPKCLCYVYLTLCFNDSNCLIIYLLYNNTTWNQYSIYNGNLQIHYSEIHTIRDLQFVTLQFVTICIRRYIFILA